MSKVFIDNMIDPKKLRADLEIDQIQLDTCMMRQPGLFAYYASLHAKAEHQFAKLEQLLEIHEARIDKEIRNRGASAGMKVTEAQIKAEILADPRYIKYKTAANEARMVMTLCKSGTEAFRHRRDMLIQVGFNQREENKGAPRVLEQGNQIRREARHERAKALQREAFGSDAIED